MEEGFPSTLDLLNVQQAIQNSESSLFGFARFFGHQRR